MKMKKRLALIMAIVLLFGLFASGCRQQGDVAEAPKDATATDTPVASETPAAEEEEDVAAVEEGEEKILTIGVNGAWSTHCPGNTNLGGGSNESIVNGLIFDGLVFMRANGEAVPRAASSWEVVDGGTAIVFTLNPDCKWHDGTPVTAEDWVWSLQTYTDPDVMLADQSDFSMLAGTDDSGNELSENSVGAEALDEYTLKLTFKGVTNVDSFFISYGGEYRVLPKHLLEDVPMADFITCDFWQNPVGSGPCVFVSEQTNSVLTLASNQNYQLGAPQFDTLVIRVIDQSNMVTSLLAHEIDVSLPSMSYEEAQALTTDSSLVVQQDSSPSMMYLMCVNNRVVDDINVRKAINLAIDKQAVIDALFNGQGVPLESCVAPGTVYANTDLATEYDPELAAQLVAESDWDSSQILVLATTSSRENLTVMVGQYLQEIGINVDIQVVDGATLYGGLFDESIPMGMASLQLTADPMAIKQMFDYSLPGYFNVTDPTYAEMQAAINAEINPDTRVELVKEWQKYIYDTQPVTYICATYNYNIYANHISSYSVGGREMGTLPIWEWQIG